MLSWSIFVYFWLPNFSKFNFNFNFKGQISNWHCLMIIPLVCKVQENTICLKNCFNIAWRYASIHLKNPRDLPQFLLKNWRNVLPKMGHFWPNFDQILIFFSIFCKFKPFAFFLLQFLPSKTSGLSTIGRLTQVVIYFLNHFGAPDSKRPRAPSMGLCDYLLLCGIMSRTEHL